MVMDDVEFFNLLSIRFDVSKFKNSNSIQKNMSIKNQLILNHQIKSKFLLYLCDMEFKHQIGGKCGYEANISDLGKFWKIQGYDHDS